MKRSTLAVSLLICIRMGVQTGSAQTLTLVRIESRAASMLARQLTDAGFDVMPAGLFENECRVIVSGEELDLLRQRGLEPQFVAAGRPFREIQAGPLAVLGVPRDYPDLDQILAQLQATQTNFPGICRVVDLTETYGTPPTFEGRHLFALKISDHVAEDEDEPAFLLVGAHHAREIVTPVIALHTIEHLTEQYDVDPVITALVDDSEIWVAPVWNPDGYAHVFRTDNFWRKNRRPFPAGVGVDLNRNYPFGWNAGCGGSTSAASETYRGPAAASEAETQTMIAFGRDRRFAKVADLHSAAREVRYANGCLPHPFMAFLASEAARLAGPVGYRPALSCCTGGDIHFHMAEYGAHAFLWETHTTFQPTYAGALAEAARVLPSVMMLLEDPIPLSGYVRDALTGEPVAATVACLDVAFENGETNGSDARWGRYHAFLPAGTYTLEFAAPGYLPQYHMVEMAAGVAQIVDVLMIPLVADLNGDSRVDMYDLALFAACWRKAAGETCETADLTQDGQVDYRDLMSLANVWLRDLSPID